MRRLAPALGLVLVLSGCAALGARDRRDVVRDALASTVQLRVERAGGVRRAASGVVLDVDGDSTWIITTRHVLDPPVDQTVSVVTTGRPRRTLRADVVALSTEADVAVLRVDGLRLSPVRLRETVRLGDPVWVIAFPWGRRSTVVSGVVSQLAAEAGESALEGAVSMVDASVSYGASGGGVFDAQTGELIGLVESHRTARVTVPEAREQSFEIPVPGETTVVSVVAIRAFLSRAALPTLLPR